MRAPAGLAALAALLAAAGPARAERPLTLRFAVHVSGDVRIAADTLSSCSTGPACAAARAGVGTALDNNAFPDVRPLDVDADPATFDSATADLVLPTGARVLFAGLYWGADTAAGAGGAAAPAAVRRGVVLLRTPRAATYRPLTAAVVDDAGTRYQAFADVTPLVAAAGAGTYGFADVQAGSGTDRYAGAALVVAFAADSEVPRSIAVFDGLVDVTATRTIALTGLRAPPRGPVTARIGVVAYEGDRGVSGDAMRVDGRPLADPGRPTDDFFASVIGAPGPPTPRDPAYANQLGYDAKVVDADGVLPPGATSAAVELATTGDVYLPGVVTVAARIQAPRLRPAVSLRRVGRGAVRQGDLVEARTAATNAGDDGAAATALALALPAGCAYVRGTLRANGRTLSDRAGDDAGEVRGSVVAVRLGAGATAAAGGLVATGRAVDVRARCRIGADVARGALLRASAALAYRSAGLPEDAFVDRGHSSPLVVATRPRADLALRLVRTGSGALRARSDVAVAAIVRNRGPATATGASLVLTLPGGVALRSAPAACAPTATGASCRLGSLRRGRSARIVVRVRAAHAGRFAIVGVAVSARRDPAGHNVARLPLRVAPVRRRADLRVGLRLPRGARAGRAAVAVVRISSRGPDVAVSARLTLVAPAGLELLGGRVAHGRCRVTGAVLRCGLAPLRVGDSARVRVRLRAAAGRYVVRATAAAAAIDPSPADASARRVLLVR